MIPDGAIIRASDHKSIPVAEVTSFRANDRHCKGTKQVGCGATSNLDAITIHPLVIFGSEEEDDKEIVDSKFNQGSAANYLFILYDSFLCL